MMDISFAGQTVFVTGAASGIGLGIGTAFAKNGARVVLSDVNEARVKEEAVDLQEKGYDVLGVACDVTKEEAIQEALDQVLAEFGRLDVLVNNAGMQHVASLEEFPTEKFEQLVQIMQVAPFMTMKHAFPVMKQQGYGRIVNIASINGMIGFAGKAAYNSAKHGVIGLTKVAALEGAEDQVTVNALCPGYVDTPLVRGQMEDLAKTRNVPVEKVIEEVFYPLVPQKRLLDVDEVTNYAMYLASEQAKGVTGQAVVLDGGYTAQ